MKIRTKFKRTVKRWSLHINSKFSLFHLIFRNLTIQSKLYLKTFTINFSVKTFFLKKKRECVVVSLKTFKQALSQFGLIYFVATNDDQICPHHIPTIYFFEQYYDRKIKGYWEIWKACFLYNLIKTFQFYQWLCQ